jgi:hypothetical protein
MKLTSTLLYRSPVTGVCFHLGAVVASTSTDEEDADGCVVGRTGTLCNLSAKKLTVLHTSKEHGFVSIASLRNGDLAVGTSDHNVVILSGTGKPRRILESRLGCSLDWLAAGGEPECLFAATTESGGNAELGFEEWSTKDWTRSSVPLPGTSPPALSPRGVSRVRDDRRIAEYAWKGKPAPVTKAIVGRGRWLTVPVEEGWILSNVFGAECSFVDIAGRTRWTRKESLYAACAVVPGTILGVGDEALLVIDVATGKTLASTKRKAASDATLVTIAADGAGSFAVGDGGGVELVRVALQRAVAAPLRWTSAKPAGRVGDAGDEAPTATMAIAAFEALVGEVCAAADQKTLSRLHRKLADLDLLEASDMPAHRKKLAKGCSRLRAHARRLENHAAQRELENILDTVTSS